MQRPVGVLKRPAVGRRWSDVELIDIFKEVDLRLNFTAAYRTTASREVPTLRCCNAGCCSVCSASGPMSV